MTRRPLGRSLGRDALRYGAAGVVNTLVGLSVIVALEQGAGLNPFLANAGGYAVGICVSFVLSRLFVFGAARSWRGAAPRYAAAVVLAFGLNQGVLWLARTVLGALAWGPIVAQGAAVISYTAALFLISRYWVFAAED
ncbi:MAG: GtrA family protein [Caulobacter sp.]|nr:GtrA family protein [Caulobacter sp.]